jgi:hypothetical protein
MERKLAEEFDVQVAIFPMDMMCVAPAMALPISTLYHEPRVQESI